MDGVWQAEAGLCWQYPVQVLLIRGSVRFIIWHAQQCDGEHVPAPGASARAVSMPPWASKNRIAIRSPTTSSLQVSGSTGHDVLQLQAFEVARCDACGL